MKPLSQLQRLLDLLDDSAGQERYIEVVFVDKHTGRVRKPLERRFFTDELREELNRALPAALEHEALTSFISRITHHHD